MSGPCRLESMIDKLSANIVEYAQQSHFQRMAAVVLYSAPREASARRLSEHIGAAWACKRRGSVPILI